MNADCTETDQLLPWYLAGSLPAAEAARVARHLENCEPCRAALEATRRASEIFAAHLPAGLLVDYGLGLPVEALPRERIEAHLAHCAECRAELNLVRADSGGEGTPADSGAPASALLPFSRRTSAAGWRALALAASVTAAVALSLWFGEGRASRPLPDPAAVLLELSPEAARDRGGEVRASLSRSAAATLLLAVDRAESFERVRARASDAAGATLWEVDGLAPAAVGGFVLHLPAGALPAGEVRLELRGTLAGVASVIATYRLDVRP